VASLPFAPEIVVPTIRSIDAMGVGKNSPYGFEATFNPTFPSGNGDPWGWVSPRNFGLNNGPIVVMIENHRSGLMWKLFMAVPEVRAGLRKLGFSSPHLEEPER
jgi:hypothetical protein